MCEVQSVCGVHFYVGVSCLSSRYLAWCVSSHVQFCAGMLNTYYMPPAFFCVHYGVCVCYLCVAVWIDPLCVISDLNFTAG